MTKLNLILGILIGITIISCSSETTNIDFSTGNLIKWNHKLTNSQIRYFISNNKITKYRDEVYDDQGNVTAWGETIFIYENKKLHKMIESNSFSNSTFERTFFYNNEEKLSEIISRSNPFNNFINKRKYEYNGFTVKSTIYKSNDNGLNFELASFNPIMYFTFDTNKNLIESKKDGGNDILTFNFDENNNLVKTSDGYNTYKYSYSNIKNQISEVLIITYGKLEFPLLKHNILSDNGIPIPRFSDNISPFVIESLNKNGNLFIQTEIDLPNKLTIIGNPINPDYTFYETHEFEYE